MNAFEIFLLNPGPEPVTTDQLLAALRAVPWTRHKMEEPRPSFFYHNPDTGVYFPISVPALDSATPEADEHADGDADEDEDGDTDADTDAEPALELAAMTLSVPLRCPRFFGAEAADIACRMAAASGLEAAAGEGLSTAQEMAAAWDAANRAAAAQPG